MTNAELLAHGRRLGRKEFSEQMRMMQRVESVARSRNEGGQTGDSETSRTDVFDRRLLVMYRRRGGDFSDSGVLTFWGHHRHHHRHF